MTYKEWVDGEVKHCEERGIPYVRITPDVIRREAEKHALRTSYGGLAYGRFFVGFVDYDPAPVAVTYSEFARTAEKRAGLGSQQHVTFGTPLIFTEGEAHETVC